MKTSVLKSLGVLGYVLFMCACATTSTPPPAAYDPVFNPKFSDTGIAKDPPAHISFAIVKPEYADPSFKESPTTRLFRDSLSKEIESLIISKGFTIQGPFDSYNDMTFPQKKQADLILRPVITWAWNNPRPKAVQKSDFGSAILGGSGTKTVYETQGTCKLNGRIDFLVLESLTGTKMWTKSVSLEVPEEDCSTSAEDLSSAQVIFTNAENKLLEKAYNLTMEKIDTYFNREEMAQVKQQSLELRK